MKLTQKQLYEVIRANMDKILICNGDVVSVGLDIENPVDYTRNGIQINIAPEGQQEKYKSLKKNDDGYLEQLVYDLKDMEAFDISDDFEDTVHYLLGKGYSLEGLNMYVVDRVEQEKELKKH